MNHLRLYIFLTLGTAALRAAPTPAGTPTTSIPSATNWELPILSKEGFHTMTLHGAKATYHDNNRMDVVDLSITTFLGGATPKVDLVLLSPVASFYSKENRATGSDSVRLIRDDFEVTGREWTYDYNTRTATIAHDTRVVFHAQLKDILK